nr:disease resistance protein RPM1-like [Ipomoea trifida]
MADGAINFLLEKLSTILLQQASLLGDARDEIEEIRLELEFMRSFIRDAERRKERSELVETWVRQVREVSNQVENIIDEFMHFREMQRHGNGIRSFVKNAINLPRNIATQNHISSKLQKIKAKVHEVSERSKRSLDIKAVKAVNWPKLGTSIQMLKSLRRLSITARNEEESLELGDLISAPPFLQKLTLVGQLNGLPHWLGSLQNLTHLHLGSSLSEENILSCIDELPILVFLKLQNTYNGKILHFRARGFPKLNSLKLLEFDQLEGICLAEGALPSLRELYLIHCKELKQLPQGIEHIASIRKLHLEEMPEELIQNLRINGSKDQAKVQHIQTINHVYKIDHTPILETLS